MTISQIPNKQAKKNQAFHAQILASPASRIPSGHLSFSRFLQLILVKSRIPRIPFQTLFLEYFLAKTFLGIVL